MINSIWLYLRYNSSIIYSYHYQYKTSIPLFLQSHNSYIHDTISLIHPLYLQMTYHNLWAAWLPWQWSTSLLLMAANQLFMLLL